MAKYLAIDYGSKKIGLALSDEGGMIAFPEAIILNSLNSVSEIEKIVKENFVEGIVLGESIDLRGKKNEVMSEIEKFKESLASLSLPIYFEKEFMTSLEARRFPDKDREPSRLKKSEREAVDAKAAALILQRFLDKKNA